MNDEFDLEAYVANYTGHGKIDRLVFVAEKSSGTSRETECLKLVVNELQHTEMTTKYLDMATKLQGQPGVQFEPDIAWVDSVDRQALQRQSRLEAELNGYKTNLIKESIRMGHNDLGDFFYSRGDLSNAFKNYMRTRDYSTTSRHIIHMCLNVIKCCVEMGNYVHVPTYAQKAESTPDSQTDLVLKGKLLCSWGLFHLESGKYKLAAKKFTEVPPELGSRYNEVISSQDVALYGTLTAMASFDRSELKAAVMDSPGFREMLELVPEVREAVQEFFASRYTECIARLERLRPVLSLDLHLHDHVDKLYAFIRSRALTQYVSPFSTLDLNAMAQAFNTTAGGIESELASLIAQKEVAAHIDHHRQVLIARRPNQRAATFQQALQAGEEHLVSSKALLLRASIMKHDLIQKPMGGGGGGGAGPDRPDAPTGRHGRHREGRDRGGDREGNRGGEAREGGRAGRPLAGGTPDRFGGGESSERFTVAATISS